MTQHLEAMMNALSTLDSKTLASLSEDDLHTLESKFKSKLSEISVVRTRKINARIRHVSSGKY